MKSLSVLVVVLLVGPVRADEEKPTRIERGSVRFEPRGDQKEVPKRYRLAARSFDYEMRLKKDVPGCKVVLHDVRFPSPVVSKTPENNTVHAEYYRPRGPGKFPGIIVLDITAGDQSLSRTISTLLARNGIACLFMQMAYYGPRRPKGSDLRLLSPKYDQTMAAIRQTVLDVRCATAWLESRPEIDARRLGILGTSLGSFIGALSAEMEPKLGRVAVFLGGGGLVDAYYDDPRVLLLRQFWEAIGGSRDRLKKLIAPADPITCAANLKDRKVLILAGKRDDIVPPRAAEALWQATGRQKIVWYNCDHYGAVLYFPSAMRHVQRHFLEETSRGPK